MLEKTIEDYQFTEFELTLYNRTKELDKIDDYIDVLKENPDSLLPISAFLILLKNIDSEEVCEVKNSHLLSFCVPYYSLFSFL